MSRIAILFWIAFVAALAWGASVFVGLGVNSSYHPMAARGDLLHTLKISVIVLVIGIGMVVAIVRARRGSLPPRVYMIGLIALGIVSLLPLLPRVDSGYEQTYYIGDQAHAIPWQFDPSGGSDIVGGERFSLRAVLPDMAAQYAALSRSVTLGKALDFASWGDGPEADGLCDVSEYTTRCEWRVGEFVYSVSGDNDNMPDMPDDIDALKDEIVSFLDGFAVAPS